MMSLEERLDVVQRRWGRWGADWTIKHALHSAAALGLEEAADIISDNVKVGVQVLPADIRARAKEIRQRPNRIIATQEGAERPKEEAKPE